jgi:hypothetical protein
LVLVILSLLLAACGSTKETNFPTGKFINSGDQSHGLSFNEDGTYIAFFGEETIATGTYSVNGDTFTDAANPYYRCPEWSFKYTWNGTNLTFHYIGDRTDDPCGGTRGNAFDNQTYTLSK